MGSAAHAACAAGDGATRAGVTTGIVNDVPVGVQVVAAHHREDLCLLAGRDIEARGAPVAVVDPIV